MARFPRVLLLDFSFTNTSGMGITLTNLFNDWPKENIAVMSDNVDPRLCEQIRPCVDYIGVETIIDIKSIKKGCNVAQQRNKLRNTIKRIYNKAGIGELSYKPNVLEVNLERAKSFDPDIIFCGLGNLRSMRLCKYVITKFPESKLALYIVDDWVNSRVYERYFPLLWKKLYDLNFRQLLDISSLNLSICKSMSDSYFEQYGKVFHPFHNPVDTCFWHNIKCSPKYPDKTQSILYVGKINYDTTPCLKDLAEVVEELNGMGYQLEFDVYSPDFRLKYDLFDGLKHCHVFDAIPHSDIPEVTKSYTALFLPLGFSKKTVRYVRLSMPTKLSEYLASERPVLLYAPAEIALTQFVQLNNCAIVCTNKNKKMLSGSVMSLFDNKYVSDILVNSKKIASALDIHKIRNGFLKTVSSI